jgi:hypothetical protein
MQEFVTKECNASTAAYALCRASNGCAPGTTVSFQALFRLYSGSIQALFRLF